MRRVFSIVLTLSVLFCCTCMMALGYSDGQSLDEMIKSNNASEQTTQGQTQTDVNQKEVDRQAKSESFIAGLNRAADLTDPVDGIESATSGIRLVAAWIVQVLSYAITAFLAVRVVLDLTYIGLPFTRGILANGYAGNAQAGNTMANGGMGMGGMNNGMGGMGMGGMGMNGGYGMRGGYGMNRGMGMGMGGMGGMGMNGGMNPSGVNQQGSMMGRVQWVSNAALTAVASENNIGQDGKVPSPFKIYAKDMAITLIVVPVLLILAATGALTNLGFLIGNLLCDAIAGIGEMI